MSCVVVIITVVSAKRTVFPKEMKENESLSASTFEK